MDNFVHLHVHSEYTLLESVCRIEELIKGAKSLGQSAIALTDRGVLFGAVDFYKTAQKHGVKAIIGCELSVRTVTSLADNLQSFVFLCKNNEGYNNLVKLVSSAQYNYSVNCYVIDFDKLYEYHNGLICLSGSLNGCINSLLSKGDFDGACNVADKCKKLFGDDFYIELTDNGNEQDKANIVKLLRISESLNIETVCANEVYYINQSDADIQNVLYCIGKGLTVKDSGVNPLKNNSYYLKSTDEMNSLFGIYENSVQNTIKIAEQCNVSFEFGVKKLPEFMCDTDHLQFLKKLCRDGMYEKYGKNPSKEIVDRIKYELDTINEMGYVDYYLIVWDFINYARSRDIPVGPGRGSGAGSIIAYLIGITGIDPIKYNLIFERFLNPERVSMPDFDIDFCHVRRQEVIDYLYKKYGNEHVAQIVTFGTLAARAAVRDVGRVLDLPLSYVDLIAKAVPNELGITLEKALAENEQLRNIIKDDYTAKELIYTAKRVEGLPRHSSIHAAGVVVTASSVDDYVPVSKENGTMVTQYTMTLLEELGLLKIDLLGLRNLTIIDDAVKFIRISNPEFSIENIDIDDKAVYAMFSLGNTEGVFQFESEGMKRVLRRLKPTCLEDLIAVISLYRPGPMDSIPKYINNRHNPKNIQYHTPLLKPILDVTYGCLVYQEQVMQVFRELAGYSFGRADVVRRAMSKKKHDVMENERDNFINGAKQRGVEEQAAQKIFDEMSSFASYAFNKSHAAAYALVSYRTAWLKVHYPKEYMSALLSSVTGNSDKISRYTMECDALSLELLSPDINSSYHTFYPSDDGIRFPLSTIKNVGTVLADAIVEERENNGKYTSLIDFCQRINRRELNQTSLEWLIKAGALDGVNLRRKQLMNSFDKVLSSIQSKVRTELKGQINLFGTKEKEESFHFVECDEFDCKDLIKMEKEALGISFFERKDKLKPVSATTQNQMQNKKNKYCGLHIRFDSEQSENLRKVKNLLSIFEGTTPVYFKFEDTQKRIKLPSREFVQLNEPLVRELRKLIGEENLVIID